MPRYIGNPNSTLIKGYDKPHAFSGALSLKNVYEYGVSGQPPSDPYWLDTEILLKFEAPDGSKYFINEVPYKNFEFFRVEQYNKSGQISGWSKITTARSKFGSSCFTNGSGNGNGTGMVGNAQALAVSELMDCTVECWIYLTANATADRMIFGVNNGGYYDTCSIGNAVDTYGNRSGTSLFGPSAWGLYRTTTGNLKFTATFGSVNFSSSSAPLTLNAWHHVALVKKDAGITIYCDGSAVASSAQSIAKLIALGTFFFGEGDVPDSLFIDELRFTRAARYTSNFSVPTASFYTPKKVNNNFVMICHMETNYEQMSYTKTLQRKKYFHTTGDRSSSDIRTPQNHYYFPDSSLQGSFLHTSVNASLNTTTKKFGSGSCYLNNGGLLYRTPTHQVIGAGDFEIQAWFNLAGTASMCLFDIGAWGGQNLRLQVGDSYIGKSGVTMPNRLLVWGQTSWSPSADSTLVCQSTNNVITTNTWSHILLSRVSGTVRCFVNGVQVCTGASSVNISNPFIGIGFTSYPITVTAGFYRGTTGYVDDLCLKVGAGTTSNFSAPTNAISDPYVVY